MTASLAFALTALLVWRVGLPSWSGRRWSIGLIAALAGAGAMQAQAAPTGWTLLDAVLRASFAMAFVLGATRVRTAWSLSAAVLMAAVGVIADSPVEVGTWASVGALAALALASVRIVEVVGVAAALLAQVMLRLDWPLATGVSLAAGVAVAALVLVPAWWAVPRTTRRAASWVTAAVASFWLLASVAAALASAQARSAVERGIDAAEAGIAALGDDSELARRKLEEAAASFAEGEADLAAWWVGPARSVPLVAQQLRAVTTMASSGRELSALVADTVELATTDAIRPRSGEIDLDAVSDLAVSLGVAHGSLVQVASRLDAVASPWLVPPVAEVYDELSRRVADATVRASNAAEGAGLAPALLGDDELRRYFVAVLTPAEARGGGGFMGNWAEITAKNGRLEMTRFGRVADLTDGGPNPDGRSIVGQDEYLARYGDRTARFWGLVNFSVDFPTVAEVIGQLYPQSGGQQLDGVIAVDPYAFEALLEVVGPVSVPGSQAPLTPRNAARVLLHDQYVAFAGDPASEPETGLTPLDEDPGAVLGGGEDKERVDSLVPEPEAAAEANKDPEPLEEEREDFLAAATVLVFDRLVDGEFDSPRALVDALGPAIRGRHLQLASFHPDEQLFFERVDASGLVPPLRGDSVGFVGQNYGGNKIDWFLRREATYDVVWDPATGAVQSSLEVRLHNDAPATGLPPSVIGYGGDAPGDRPLPADGENLMELSLYSAMPPLGATLDGVPMEGALQEEFGRSVFTSIVVVPPGATRIVRLTADGTIGPGDVYRLDPLFQAVVTPDRLDVNMTLADGWTIASAAGSDEVSATSVTASWLLDRQHLLEIRAERVGEGPGLIERLRGEA